jgi:hypothetical protein
LLKIIGNGTVKTIGQVPVFSRITFRVTEALDAVYIRLVVFCYIKLTISGIWGSCGINRSDLYGKGISFKLAENF